MTNQTLNFEPAGAKNSSIRRSTLMLFLLLASAFSALSAVDAKAASMFTYVEKHPMIHDRVARDFTIDYKDANGVAQKDVGMLVDVVLPNNYDPNKEYPLLVMIHGIGGWPFDLWKEGLGNVRNFVEQKNVQAITVVPSLTSSAMPIDWVGGLPEIASFPYFGGTPRKADIQTYFDSVVMPGINKRFKIAPGRQNHAIAGVSLGGMSATYLAERDPDYWGSVGVFSGFTTTRDGYLAFMMARDFGLNAFDLALGPVNGINAISQDPLVLSENLRHTRMVIYRGDGRYDERETNPDAKQVGVVAEWGVMQSNDPFVAKQKSKGIPVDYVTGLGVHSWTYFQPMIDKFFDWGPFKADNSEPTNWTYDTGRKTGSAWGNRFAFDSAPQELVRFTKTGDSVAISKSGPLTVTTREDCQWRGQGPAVFKIGSCKTTPGPVPPAPAVKSVLKVSTSLAAPMKAFRTYSHVIKVTDPTDGGSSTVANATVKIAGSTKTYTTDDGGQVRINIAPTKVGTLYVEATRSGYEKGSLGLPVVKAKPAIFLSRTVDGYTVKTKYTSSKSKIMATVTRAGKSVKRSIVGKRLVLGTALAKKGAKVKVTVYSPEGAKLVTATRTIR